MQIMGNQFDNMCLENILLQGIEESHYILEKKGRGLEIMKPLQVRSTTTVKEGQRAQVS